MPVIWDDEAAPAPASGASVQWDEPQTRATEAGAAGFLEPTTLGFADELTGLLAKIGIGEGVKLGKAFEAEGGEPQEVRAAKASGLQAQAAQPSTYELGREAYRRRERLAKEERPGMYAAGQVGGAVASALLPGMKGASAGRAALTGAGLGAAYGLGTSEADLTEGELGGAARDVLYGGALGAAGGAAGHALAGVAGPALGRAVAGAREAAGRGLQRFAERRAAKAAGAIQSDLSKMTPEQIQRFGRDVLEEQVVRFGSGAEATLQRAREMLSKRGKEIGAALDEVDKAGVPLDLNPVWRRINDDVASVLAGNPVLRRRAKLVTDAIEDLATAQREGPVGFAKLHELRVTLDEDFFRGEPTAVKNLGRKLRRILESEIEDQMTAAPGLVAVAKPGDVSQQVARGLREAYETAKAPYGSLKTAVKVGKRAVQRQVGNRWISLTDYLVGLARSPVTGGAAVGGGAMLGGIPGAIGGAVIHKLLRERGASAAAVAARSFANAARRPGSLAKMSRIMAEEPERLGRFSAMLAEAASQGDEALAALHASAESDPEYRAALEAAE